MIAKQKMNAENDLKYNISPGGWSYISLIYIHTMNWQILLINANDIDLIKISCIFMIIFYFIYILNIIEIIILINSI
jgi:hypothetical protein